jgi:hypothetical protein
MGVDAAIWFDYKTFQACCLRDTHGLEVCVVVRVGLLEGAAGGVAVVQQLDSSNKTTVRRSNIAMIAIPAVKR